MALVTAWSFVRWTLKIWPVPSVTTIHRSRYFSASLCPVRAPRLPRSRRRSGSQQLPPPGPRPPPLSLRVCSVYFFPRLRFTTLPRAETTSLPDSLLIRLLGFLHPALDLHCSRWFSGPLPPHLAQVCPRLVGKSSLLKPPWVSSPSSLDIRSLICETR